MDLRHDFVEVIVLFHLGFWREAIEYFKKIVKEDFYDEEILPFVVMSYCFLGELEEALDWVYCWLEVNDKSAKAWYRLGLIWELLGNFDEAILSFKTAISCDFNGVEVYNCLANTLVTIGDFEQAVAVCQEAISIVNNSTSYLILGNIFLAEQNLDEAISAYSYALHLKPRNNIEIMSSLGVAFQAKGDEVSAYFYLGYAAYQQKDYESAIFYFNKFKQSQTGTVEFYRDLADCYQKINAVDLAILVYEEALNLFPYQIDIYLNFMLALQNFGRTDEAIEAAKKGMILLPNNLSLQVESLRLLPVIYENTSEMEIYRLRFSLALSHITETYLDTPEACKNALRALGYNTNFYLQYQGKNDLNLQKKYGKFVCKVMALNYPQWVKIRPNCLLKNRKIRVGYVSACFQWHTVGIVFLGWLQNCNRENFEIFGYSLDNIDDNLNQLYRLFCDNFYAKPNNLEAICKQIEKDNLDILVFLDVGMYAPMTQIAGLRLAPIQCAAWGHPVTTGLPTIDYFISGDLMEPTNAENHYSEKLIRLPNIGIYYKKPVIPKISKNRENFGFKDEEVVYICCQSLFKYLPQYDYVFAEIASKVKNAKFVFVSHESLAITDKFRRRLKVAFDNSGLIFDDFCVILPRLNKLDYWNLLLVSDIFLDTFDFTGFLTSLEAISCNLPVVTRLGKLMRGCQSAGILRRISVKETLAETEEEYINIAVSLGLDKEMRNQLREKINQQKFKLYEDKSCVDALESFYRQVCRNNVGT